jgi:hypothetical protein
MNAFDLSVIHQSTSFHFISFLTSITIDYKKKLFFIDSMHFIFKMDRIVFLSIVLVVNGFDPAQFTLSTTGTQFQPANPIELLATFLNTPNAASCAMFCYHNGQCRTLDLDSNLKQCRLFEGSVDTGTLVSTSLSSSVVGWINIPPSAYNMYNASSDQCVNNRFLISDTSSGLCQCPIHTFWNGSMCLNQRYAGEVCQNNNWCRTDLNISCFMSVCDGKKYLPSETYELNNRFEHLLFLSTCIFSSICRQIFKKQQYSFTSPFV